MGQCLRGKMVGAGILPAPATAMVDPGAALPETTVAPEPETAIAEPALDVTAPEPGTDVPENLIAATFGLLRAEPDGSVVIAGSGTPGSEIEVYSNGALLGKATVESSGDWVLVPAAPIPPGGTEITLGEAGKTGVAEQSFVVAINEDKTSEPLVVASTPGAASQVLQGLGAPAAAAEPMQTAAADPVVPPVEPPTANAETVPAAAPAEEPVTRAEATETIVETAAVPAEPPAVSVPADVVTDAQPSAPDTETAAATLTPAEPAAASAAETAVAAVEPAQAVPAMMVDATPPTIDAIEIEGDKTFFAGGGPEGAALRLYIDDQFIADTTVSDGRWLVEAGDVLNEPSQRIRIDVLQPDSAKVASRAEVNFVVDLPGDDTPVAVAQAETPAVATPEVPPAAEPAAAAEPATATAAPTEPAPATSEPAVVAEPAAAPESAPSEPALAVAPPASAEATEAEAAPAVETPPGTPPAQPAEPEPAAATSAAEPTTPEPSTETPAAEPDVPTLVAVAVGDPTAARFASGKAIIRRGDNLWTIARRVYGEGIKYTTIYQANTGQIRDPDRIYPGQVFDLPEGAN